MAEEQRADVTYLGPKDTSDPSTVIEVGGRQFAKGETVENVPKTVVAEVERVAAEQPYEFKIERQPARREG